MGKYEKMSESGNEQMDGRPKLELVSTDAESGLGKYEDDASAQMLDSLSENTTVEDLRTLAKSGLRNIRVNVAENRNTPQDVLRALATDEESYVRWGVAKNPKTSVDILKILLNDLGEEGNVVDIGESARINLNRSQSSDDESLAA